MNFNVLRRERRPTQIGRGLIATAKRPHPGTLPPTDATGTAARPVFRILRQSLLAITLAALTAGVCQSCEAQSLWNRTCSRKAFQFYDTQARHVGDILTVLVSESTDVDNRDERELDRSADASGGFSIKGGWGGDLGDKEGNANFDLETNGQGRFDGSSAYSVERGFTDRITVTVVNCLPNGNLVIYGRRNRVVTGERRALTVSGVVRPLDILANNSIESQFIADFRICYDGDGIESRFTDQGWLTRTWNKYRPF